MTEFNQQNYSNNYNGGQNFTPAQYYTAPVYSEAFLKRQKEKQDKSKIRKAALATGLPFLLLTVFPYLYRFIIRSLVSVGGVLGESIRAFYLVDINSSLVSALISTFIFILFFTIGAKISKFRVSSLIPFTKPKKGTVLPLFVIGFSFCMFANFLTLFFENFFESFGINYSIGSDSAELSVWSFIVAVISTAVIPGLVEEFACRGIVMGILLPYGEGFAVLSSAIIFGAMHGNFEQIPFAFIVGLILGYIRVKTGSVWLCMAIHFSNNLFAVLAQYLSRLLPEQLPKIIYIALVTTVLIVGLVTAFSFAKKEGVIKLDRVNTEIKEGKKYKWYFTSPFVLISLIICFLESFRYFV